MGKEKVGWGREVMFFYELSSEIFMHSDFSVSCDLCWEWMTSKMDFHLEGLMEDVLK